MKVWGNVDRKKVILYGAGLGGRRAIKSLPRSFQVLAVADDDPTKAGSTFCGLPVISTANIPDYPYEIVAITSWIHAKVLRDRLTNLGVNPDCIFIFKRNILLNDKQFPWRSFLALATLVLISIAILAAILFVLFAHWRSFP